MKTAEEMVREKGSRVISVSPDTTIHDALVLMTNEKVGAIFVSDAGKLVGVWTERDLMRNTIQDGFHAKSAKIGDHMTRGVKSAAADDTVFSIMDKFLGLRLRHLPVEKDGEYIGILSIGDALKESLNSRSEELQKLNEQMKWEYYEEWRWRQAGRV